MLRLTSGWKTSRCVKTRFKHPEQTELVLFKCFFDFHEFLLSISRTYFDLMLVLCRTRLQLVSSLWPSLDSFSFLYLFSTHFIKTWSSFISGIFKSTCYIDVRWFPFDVQRCDLKFGSWTYGGWSLDLQMIEADVTGYIANGEWDLVGTSTSTSRKPNMQMLMLIWKLSVRADLNLKTFYTLTHGAWL